VSWAGDGLWQMGHTERSGVPAEVEPTFCGCCSGSECEADWDAVDRAWDTKREQDMLTDLETE
jgi:hypothetical protein